jgi:hypothetical protein
MESVVSGGRPHDHIAETCSDEQSVEIVCTPERERTLRYRGSLGGYEASQCCKQGREARAVLHRAPDAKCQPAMRRQHTTHFAKGGWSIWEEL